MYPAVDTYEVMPWPDRIYQGLYQVAGTDRKERIPRDYSTQMQIMVNTLNDIRTSETQVSGTHGIGVLMANSLMFQRFPDHDGYDDPQFSSFLWTDPAVIEKRNTGGVGTHGEYSVR